MENSVSKINNVFGLHHVTDIMSGHQNYLKSFLKLQEFIIYGEGPLPIQYRHYIAIMAAARHKCTYLINFHKKQFLDHRGDSNWLIGLSHVPSKLRNLNEVNKILAHRPWLITAENIKKFTREICPNTWSLSDFGHAIILLVHFHSLCSFVFACNLNDEIPRAAKVSGLHCTPISKHYSSFRKNASSDEGLESIMEKMKNLNDVLPASEQERIQRYELVQSQLCDSDASADNGLESDVKPYVEDSGYSYLDCSRRKFSQQSSFILQEFSWDHHGYSLAIEISSDETGKMLDEKFKTAYNMTYNTMGGCKDIDTTRFRRAIWNYIYCIYGIRNDDYDYEEVTLLLQKPLREFVKTAACYPERLNKTLTENALKHFEISERIHINLMIMEARMQSALLFALRAIENLMRTPPH